MRHSYGVNIKTFHQKYITQHIFSVYGTALFGMKIMTVNTVKFYRLAVKQIHSVLYFRSAYADAIINYFTVCDNFHIIEIRRFSTPKFRILYGKYYCFVFCYLLCIILKLNRNCYFAVIFERHYSVFIFNIGCNLIIGYMFLRADQHIYVTVYARKPPFILIFQIASCIPFKH